MEKKEVYREKVQDQLKEWEAKIELKTAVEKLQAKQHDLKKRVSDMKSSGGEAWGHLKEVTEKAVAEMKSTIDKAIVKFK